MRHFIGLTLICFATVFAAPQLDDPNHYAQHRAAIEAARHGKTGRLESFNTADTQSIVPGDDICGLCESGAVTDTESIGSTGGVVIPIGGGGGESTSTSEFSSSSSTNQGHVPVIIGGGSSSSSQFSSSQQSESVSNPIVIPVTSGGGSESYHSHRESISSQSSPVIQQTILVPSGGVERYSHSRYETSGGGGVPLAPFPITSGGSSFSSSRRNERVSQAVPAIIPVPIFPTGGSNSRYSSSQFKEVSQAAPTVVTFNSYPSGGSIHTESRFSEIKATPITPFIIPVSTGGGSSHKSSSFRESHSSHATPQVVYTAPIVPSGGSSSFSRHESYTKHGSGGHIVPIAPIVSYPSVSSNFREESSSSSGGGFGGGPIVSYPSGSSSSFREESSASSGSDFGGNVGIVSYPSGTSSSFREESSSSGNGFGGSHIGVVGYPSITSGGHLSSRFSDYHGSSDLGHYMSESERLARERLHSSAGYNNINAVDFGQAQLTPSTGSQSKSWEKSSKWSSQSEYDQAGRTKSSGFLSTAEGEDETRNGIRSGYRAATTTVDNDGQRRTVSIHS